MYVKVLYYKGEGLGYSGREYTYKTDLPVYPGTKVIADTFKGEQKAIISQINVPETEVDPAWADKIKVITKIDTEGVEAE